MLSSSECFQRLQSCWNLANVQKLPQLTSGVEGVPQKGSFLTVVFPPTHPPIKRTEWQIYRWLVFSFEYWGKYRDHSPIPSQCNHSLSIYSSHYLTKSEFDRHSFSRCLIDLFNVGLELYCFLLLYPLRWEFVGIFFSLWHHYNLPRPSPTPPFSPPLPVFELILTCICVI